MRRILVSGAVIIVVSALAVACATTRAPEASRIVLTGRVLDAGSGRPLPGVQVLIEGTPAGALSDSNGDYRIVVDAGKIRDRKATLVASVLGYERTEAAVDVTADAVHADLRMNAAVIALEELAVTDAVAVPGRPLPAERARERFRAERQRFRAAEQRFSAAPHNPVVAPPPGWNTESYDLIHENAFVAVDRNPLSTFSIDVDRASYSNIRRFLLDGERPPKDAVRIEEMVNYFPYDYPEPAAGEPFSITADVASAPWRPEHRLVRIGLRSPAVAVEDLPPSNLVFLLDVSGSMRPPDKLPLVKQSMRLLVDALREQDRVAIVVYAGAAGLVLPSTPGSDRTAILDAIERLEAGGSTAGGAGIRLAYDVAREHFVRGGNNRVILATDGDFNIGASSDAEMVRLIEEKRRQGVFLTVLGFGTGNLKDSKMEKLADHGNGNYAYIDGRLEARKVLVGEMGGTLLTVAKDVKLQIEFNPARVQAYRLIGYENRLLADEDFNDDTKDAGELGAGHSVTALYEVVPAGIEPGVEIRGVDPLRYGARPEPASASNELAYVKIRYKAPDGERSRLLERPIADRVGRLAGDFAFAASVAGFGMLLRDSEHRGEATAELVLELARAAGGEDPHGYRAEFLELVETWRRLARGEAVAAGTR